MNKSRILLIGAGRCGNKIVDEMISYDPTYSGLFINTTKTDLSDLENLTKRNVFVIPNASGTGKNRSLAKEYLREERGKIQEIMEGYDQQDTILCIASVDGGSGSGITPTLIKMIDLLTEGTKKINLLAVFPKMDEGKIAMENTIEFWKEIAQLIEDNVLASIMFVDNNKRKTESEINEKIIEDLDACYSANGTTDEEDSEIVNNASGYKIVLNLEDGFETLDDAIEEAIEDSVFVYPAEGIKKAKYLLALMSDYDSEYAKQQYSASVFKKFGESEDYNTMILGGCRIPVEVIQPYNEKLKEIIKEEREESNRGDSLLAGLDLDILEKDTKRKKKTNTVKISGKTKKSKKEKINLLNDPDIWL